MTDKTPPDLCSAAENLLQILCGYDDTCAAFSAMMNALSEQDRLKVMYAIQDLENAIDKSKGE